MALKWLTNIYNPKMPDAKQGSNLIAGEDRDVAWEQHKSWLADKVIGEPKPTARWNVEQMKQMGLVGVYVNLEEYRELQIRVHPDEPITMPPAWRYQVAVGLLLVLIYLLIQLGV